MNDSALVRSDRGSTTGALHTHMYRRGRYETRHVPPALFEDETTHNT